MVRVEELDPRVGLAHLRGEQAGDVARGDAEGAQQADGRVGVVLADAVPPCDGLLRRGEDGGVAALVDDVALQPGGDGLDDLQQRHRAARSSPGMVGERGGVHERRLREIDVAVEEPLAVDLHPEVGHRLLRKPDGHGAGRLHVHLAVRLCDERAEDEVAERVVMLVPHSVRRDADLPGGVVLRAVHAGDDAEDVLVAGHLVAVGVVRPVGVTDGGFGVRCGVGGCAGFHRAPVEPTRLRLPRAVWPPRLRGPASCRGGRRCPGRSCAACSPAGRCGRAPRPAPRRPAPSSRAGSRSRR